MLLSIFKYWYMFLIILIIIAILIIKFIPKKQQKLEIVEEKTYRIHFVTNTKEEIDDYIVEEGIVIDIYPSVRKNGYYFRGWCIDPECTKVYNKKTPITSDLTLYAKWQEQSMDEFLNDTNIVDFRKEVVKTIKNNYKDRNEK